MEKNIKDRKKMKEMTTAAGIATVLQTGLILENKGLTMMKDEEAIYKKEYNSSQNNLTESYEGLFDLIIEDRNFTKEKLLFSLKKEEKSVEDLGLKEDVFTYVQKILAGLESGLSNLPQDNESTAISNIKTVILPEITSLDKEQRKVLFYIFYMQLAPFVFIG